MDSIIKEACVEGYQEAMLAEKLGADRIELCSHLEMETYTWEVLPNQMKNRDVVDQLVGEYEWTLGELTARGLA